MAVTASMLITVSGSKDFARFADAMARASRADFDREMDRSLKDAGEDIATAVRADTEHYMPSGYEGIFAARFMTKVEKATSFRGITVVAWGKGRTRRRDVERLNQGQLRHPVFGRTRPLPAQGRYAKRKANIVGGVYKNPWAVTKIKPGFFDNPVRLHGRKAVKKRGDEGIDRLFDGIRKAAF